MAVAEFGVRIRCKNSITASVSTKRCILLGDMLGEEGSNRLAGQLGRRRNGYTRILWPFAGVFLAPAILIFNVYVRREFEK